MRAPPKKECVELERDRRVGQGTRAPPKKEFVELERDRRVGQGTRAHPKKKCVELDGTVGQGTSKSSSLRGREVLSSIATVE